MIEICATIASSHPLRGPKRAASLLRKAGGRRNRDHESSKPDIHRITDRTADGFAARGRCVSESGRYVRSQIAALGIGDGGCRVRAYRALHRGAARAILHRKMHAPDKKESKTKPDHAKNQKNEHRRDDGEFHRGGALLVSMQRSEEISHDQPNLMMAVRVMGLGKAAATLRRAKSG